MANSRVSLPCSLLLLSCILIFSCTPPTPTVSTPMPDLMTVAKQMDKIYALNETDSFNFSLAKKPDGWFLVKRSKLTQKPIDEALFWSKKENKYLVLPLKVWKSASGTPQSLQRDLINEKEFYDRSLYYGYDGWNKDVIDALENKLEKKDTLWEMLARAYAQRSMDIIRTTKNYSLNRMSISDEQATDFMQNADKEIECYENIVKLNPGYMTFVGGVSLKRANTYMYAFSELSCRGRRKEAEKYLPDNLYDPLMLNYAKNTLLSAGKQSIIFTTGDNDTYPMWYAQEKLGIRKDVAILNLSLLAIPDWLYYWKAEKGFALGMPESFYRDSTAELILIGENSSQSSAVPGMEESMITMNAVRADYANYTRLPNGVKRNFCLSSPSVSLTYSDLPMACEANFTQPYIFIADFATMDIVASNYPERDIYFMQTVEQSYYRTYAEDLVTEGLLVKFDPTSQHKYIYNSVNFDRSKLAENIANYDYHLGDTKHLQSPGIVSNYFVMFNALANIYLMEKDTLNALKVLDDGVSKINIREINECIPCVYLGLDYMNCGNTPKAAELFGEAISDLELQHARKPSSEELSYWMAVLDHLSSDISGKGMQEIESRIVTERKELEKLMAD